MTTLSHVRPEPSEASWPDERPLCPEALEAAAGALIYWGGDLGVRGKRALEAAVREYIRVAAQHGESDGVLAYRRDLEVARQRARARVVVSGSQR